MPIHFDVPTPAAAPGSLQVRPAKLRAWIESLPLTVPFESGRQLLAHAQALAGTVLDAGTRLELLELHAGAAAKVLPELERLYAESGPPLEPAARSALGLVRDYSSALVAGYKRVAADFEGKLLGSRAVAAALRRAMHFASLRMIAAYESYTPVPQGAWADLHQVYVRAEEARVAGDTDAESKRSIGQQYAEVLLLSLSDPYRLGAGQLRRVLDEARRMSPAIVLHRKREAVRGQYLVSCDTDRPPKPALSANEDTGGPNWRLLDPTPALRHVQAAIESQQPLGPGGRALLEKVARLWADPPKRTSRRDPTEGTAAICAGLQTVGQLISVESKADLLTQDESLRKGITMPLLAVLAEDDSGPLPVHEWEVLNQSAGGLRVRRSGGPQSVGVGEVVAIRLPGKPRWSIGAARWITLYDSGGMEFGLQFMAEHARTVRVRDWGGYTKAGLYFEPYDNEPPKLLTPPETFSERKEYELEHEEERILVRAVRMRERTNRFELFEVSLA
jgi:cyclic-di-GMP-binding protein